MVIDPDENETCSLIIDDALQTSATLLFTFDDSSNDLDFKNDPDDAIKFIS